MSEKNLLFICGNIGKNSSQGVRYRNLLPNLTSHYSITLLSFNKFINYSEINNISLTQKTEYHDIIQPTTEKITISKKIKDFYKKYIRYFIFPDRYKYYIPHYKTIIKDLLQTKKYTAVVVAMTPYSLYSLPRFIKEQNSSLKVIVDLSDPFLNNVSNKYSFLYGKQHVEKFERKSLNYVDHLVVLNPTIKNIYKQIYGIQKISVIEQGLNDEIFIKTEIKDFKNKKSILVYGGGLYHKFREPFELYAALNQMGNDIFLKIFGNIDESLQPKNNKKIKYYGQINHAQLTTEYNNTDILVFIDNDKGMQVPGKILELLAIGKPILFIYSNDKSPTIHYASKSKFVVMVKNNRNEIIKGIEYILNTDLKTLPKPDLSIYYWKNLANNYIKIING